MLMSSCWCIAWFRAKNAHWKVFCYLIVLELVPDRVDGLEGALTEHPKIEPKYNVKQHYTARTTHKGAARIADELAACPARHDAINTGFKSCPLV